MFGALDVSHVKTMMKSMFEYAGAFNHDISSWEDVSASFHFSGKFKGALSFHQSFCYWGPLILLRLGRLLKQWYVHCWSLQRSQCQVVARDAFCVLVKIRGQSRQRAPHRSPTTLLPVVRVSQRPLAWHWYIPE
jgi:hypothetical protein